MASRPRRITAQQAIDLFQTINESDSSSEISDVDLDLDDDYSVDERGEEGGLFSCFGRSLGRSRSRRGSSGSESADSRGALPQPGPSRPTAKRPRTEPDIFTAVRPGSNHHTQGYHFDLLPKNRRTCGVNADLDENSTELDCFFTLFTDGVATHLIDSINEYAEALMQKNKPARRRSRFDNMEKIDMYELRKLIAVTTAMGLDNRPSMIDYFSTRAPFHTPFYGQMFSRLRFETLYSTMLHVGAPDGQGKNKIEPFINLLIQKYNEAFTPYQNISIDEMIVGFKGRFIYKQFNASKPKKHHIKSFGLVDSATGYVCNLLTYYGANTSYDRSKDTDHQGGNAEKIFSTLLSVIGTGYHIYADRWYTTRNLIEYLLQQEHYYTGTVQRNRKGFPTEARTLTNRTLRHKESRYWISEQGHLLVCAWQDKKANKPVVIVSTNAAEGNVEINGKQKPSVIANYNMLMNGCDKADQMVGYYGIFKRKSRKWWEKIFHWALEITCHNAHKLFVMTRPAGATPRELSLRKFKLNLIEQLSAAAAEVTPLNLQPKKVGRPAANPVQRLEGCKHMIVYVKEDRRCAVCSTPAKKKRTNFICKGCDGQPHLHPKECFEIWHT